MAVPGLGAQGLFCVPGLILGIEMIIRHAHGKKLSLQKYSWKGNVEPEITAYLIGNLFLSLIPAETAVIPGGPPSHLTEPEQVLNIHLSHWQPIE